MMLSYSGKKDLSLMDEDQTLDRAPGLSKPKPTQPAANTANTGFFIQGISAKPATKLPTASLQAPEAKKPAALAPMKKTTAPSAAIKQNSAQKPIVQSSAKVQKPPQDISQQQQQQQQQLSNVVKPTQDLSPNVTQQSMNEANPRIPDQTNEVTPSSVNNASAATEPAHVVPAQKAEDTFGKVNVKYNHYNNEFEIKNGKLSFAAIDEQYCFSFVFKGNYNLRLKLIASKEQAISENKEFIGLEDKGKYAVEVDEDPVEAEKEVSRPYVAPKKDDESLKKKNQRVEDITGELKGMSIEELKQKGDAYKQLIEARDLEDVLFS